MDTPITSFTGPYRFLSNFWPCAVPFDMELYPSSEHAYQAAKTIIPKERELIRGLSSPGKAKHVGRSITLRDDWPFVKLVLMQRIVFAKFINNPVLGERLRNTGDAELVEGNPWHDRYWGQSPVGVGENHLGIILMHVRSELRRTAR